MKGPAKRKVKEHRLRVVGLVKFSERTPTGFVRDSITRNIWIQENTNQDEILGKIQEAFNWSDECSVKFLYANGRNLRVATPKDVENCEGSWDGATVKALMGSGCLYVLREQRERKTESQPVVVDVSSNEQETEGVSPTLSSSKAFISDDDDGLEITSKSIKVNVLLFVYVTDDSLLQSTNLQSLTEMFYMLPEESIKKCLLSNDINETVDHLIQQAEATQSGGAAVIHEVSWLLLLAE